MSYCRFSSMDFLCDLYVYEAYDGFAVHVARSRPDWTPPEPRWNIIMDAGKVPGGEWQRRQDAYMEALDSAERKAVNHRWAGESFYGLELDEAYDMCAAARADGLNVPESLLPDLYEVMVWEHWGFSE